MHLAQFLFVVAGTIAITLYEGAEAQAQRDQTPRLVWTPFISKELGFTATFPGKPTFERLITRNRHEILVYKVELGFPYRFEVYGEVMDKEVPKEELSEYLAKEGERRSERRFHKSKKDIKAGDLKGLELDTGYMSDGGEVSQRIRVFRLGRMYYSVFVNYPPQIKYDAPIDKFLNSFTPPDPNQKKPESSADKDQICLRDSFKGPNGVRLDFHLMDNGPGWTAYGTGEWRLYESLAKISVPRGQDVIAADAGKATVTLTCDLHTPEKDVKGLDAGLVVRLVDNDNYWLVALYQNQIQVYKKAAGAFASLTTVPFAFQPKTTYPIKVIVADDLLTLFVGGKQQAQVKMDAFQNAAKFGLRDNSAPNRQPSWGNFQVASP